MKVEAPLHRSLGLTDAERDLIEGKLGREPNHVELARRHGWSWEQIGDALGVSRQSVHAKYGK